MEHAIRYRSPEKKQVVDEVVLPHLDRQVSQNPCVFGFLTRALTELYQFDTPLIAVQRSWEEMEAIHDECQRLGIEVFADWAGGRNIRLMWISPTKRTCGAFVMHSNMLRPYPYQMLRDLRDVAHDMSGGDWVGNGVTAVWYDHCGTFMNGVRGINRVKFFTNSIVKKIPVCLTYAKRHDTPKSIEEANAWARRPLHDPGLHEALAGARRANQNFELSFESLHDYRGDMNMAIAKGWLAR